MDKRIDLEVNSASTDINCVRTRTGVMKRVDTVDPGVFFCRNQVDGVWDPSIITAGMVPMNRAAGGTNPVTDYAEVMTSGNGQVLIKKTGWYNVETYFHSSDATTVPALVLTITKETAGVSSSIVTHDTQDMTFWAGNSRMQSTADALVYLLANDKIWMTIKESHAVNWFRVSADSHIIINPYCYLGNEY